MRSYIAGLPESIQTQIDQIDKQIKQLDDTRAVLTQALHELAPRIPRPDDKLTKSREPQRRHRSTPKVSRAPTRHKTATTDDVLACLQDGPAKPGDIAAKLGTHHMTVVHALRALVDAGDVIKVGHLWARADEHNWTPYRRAEIE